MQHLTIALALTATMMFSAESGAAERPSVSKNAKRIGELEIVTQSLADDTLVTRQLAQRNEQQIKANKEAIEDIVVIEGPQGPAGPRGPSGRDGALAGLTCQAGQIARFDGATWLCSGEVLSVPPASDPREACITGFPFILTGTGNVLSGTTVPGTFSEACGLQSTQVSLRGPALPYANEPGASPTSSLLSRQIAPPQVDIDLAEFGENTVGIYFPPITDFWQQIGPGISASMRLSLVSIEPSINTAVQGWAESFQPTPKTLTIRQDDLGFELTLPRCIPETYSVVPVRNRSSHQASGIEVEHTLVLLCQPDSRLGENTASEVRHYDPLWQALLNAAFAGGVNESGIPQNLIDVAFEDTNGFNMSDFDRTLMNIEITELGFPSFYMDPARLLDDERSPWIAGPHQLRINTFNADTDLPQ